MLVKSVLIASILFLNFSSQCNGVKWLYVEHYHLHKLNTYTKYAGKFVLKRFFRALHRLNYHWNRSTDCPSSKERRKEFGLIAYQVYLLFRISVICIRMFLIQSLLCKRMPELMPPIIEAAKISVELCQHIFSDRRWS